MFYFLDISYTPNGAHANRLLGYYSALDKIGQDVTVVYLTPDAKKHRLDNKYKNIKIKYYWHDYVFDSYFLRFLRFHWNLWRFIHSLKKGDIVYTYGINYSTKRLVAISKIKTFAEITEHPSIKDGGKISAISEIQKYKVAVKLDKLFVISTALKDLFLSKGVRDSSIEIVNMTVDPSRFNVSKNNFKEKYIAYCGNGSNNKDGVDKLIKAFKIVSSFHPDVRLYIIGKFPSKDMQFGNLQLANDLGIMDKIFFTGVVPANEIPQMLKNADILVLNRPDSLQAKYGFPTKLGEYLLTGNPVVVTEVGDISMFLKDGESALLSSPFDDQEFASKICWLLDNPSLAMEIGKKGREVALKHFNSLVETAKIISSF